MLHICPETNGIGEFFPHAFVFPDAVLTMLDKRFHTVSFDLILAVQTKHLLNFQLNRQTVCIPAGFTRHLIALHCLVSWNHIFDNTGQHMADMRLAIGCWRSIIESKFRTVLSQFNTLFKNHVVGPEFLDFLLSLNKILIGTYFVIHLVSSLYKKQSRFLCFKWNVPWHIHAPSAVVQQKKLPLRIGMKACIH